MYHKSKIYQDSLDMVSFIWICFMEKKRKQDIEILHWDLIFFIFLAITFKSHSIVYVVK